MMSSRRFGEDNIRLYDFAKKYQENQNSTEMVKKQNAAEEKILTARLEYLNNQKELTKKNMEKEIELVRRNSSSGRDTFRKYLSPAQQNAVCTRQNTPDTLRRCNSAGKCERCLLLTSHSNKRLSWHCWNEPNISRGTNDEKYVGCRQYHEHEPTKNKQGIKYLLEETHNDNSLTSKLRVEECDGVRTTDILRTACNGDLELKSHFDTDETVEEARCTARHTEHTSHARTDISQAIQARRQEWMRTPTTVP